MSRQFFKIGALALLAVVVVWGTMAAQKTVVAAGGGGANQDIPLKATFSAGSFGPYGSYGYLDGKFTNDITDPYVHQGTKTGQNQILINQPATMGRFIMVIYRTAPGHRFVNLHLNSMLYPPVAIGDLPPECDCLQPYFIYPNILPQIQTTYFYMCTTYEYQRKDSSDEKGPYAEFTPMPKSYLNFAKMLPGDERYACGFGSDIRFRTTDNPLTTNYDESYDIYNLFQAPQVFVVKAWGNQSGVSYWTITPFDGRFKAEDNHRILQDNIYGCVPRRVTSSAYSSCDHGTFMMPFELKIERLK